MKRISAYSADAVGLIPNSNGFAGAINGDFRVHSPAGIIVFNEFGSASGYAVEAAAYEPS
jgi:hypothetical protein